jgi:hypothetical protein
MDNLPKHGVADTYPDERRKSARHMINGRVWFQWQTGDGTWRDGVGTTRNIGEAGVFVQSEFIPPVASTIKLIVVLPTGWETDTTLCLSGWGDVRHAPQEPPQTCGFGASAVFRKELPLSTRSMQEMQKGHY